MRFRFIATEKAHHSLSLLCRCLRVTRSGFYAWQERPESARATRDRQLKVLVHTSFAASKGRYGSPRIHRDLLEQRQYVSRKRVIRLMQEEKLKARVRKRFRCTTMSDHDQPVAANLLDRQFTATAPNQKWVADFTYLWTSEGWLFLAVVLDLFSRRVVGGCGGSVCAGGVDRGVLGSRQSEFHRGGGGRAVVLPHRRPLELRAVEGRGCPGARQHLAGRRALARGMVT